MRLNADQRQDLGAFPAWRTPLLEPPTLTAVYLAGRDKQTEENMSRKVSLEVEAIVTVKVKVKIPMTFVAEEGVSLEKAAKLSLKGKNHPSADLQNALTPEILAVESFDHADDYTDEGDWLQEAVQERVTEGQAKYIALKLSTVVEGLQLMA